MSFKGDIINFEDMDKLISAMYDFLKRQDLTDPEVTIHSMAGGKMGLQTFTRESLPSRDAWKKKITAKSVGAVVCVAATDIHDTRRVTVGYMPGNGATLLVSFPMAVDGLNKKEKEILEFLRKHR